MTLVYDDIWRVRIRCGIEIGAGFAVTDRLILTCAHIVRSANDEKGKIQIELPAITTKPLMGSIEHYDRHWIDKHWEDVAVIAVSGELELTPAPLGPLSPRFTSGTLLEVFGFPGRYAAQGDRGQRTQVQVIGKDETTESLQVNGVSDHDGRIAEGYSGSAAVDIRSGRVVGMVTNADMSATDRIAWVIPLSTIAKSWNPLHYLVPTEFTVDPEVIRAIQDFNYGMYSDTLSRLNRLINQYPDEPDMYYYRALSGLAGIRPGIYTRDMIRAVEKLLRYAWTLGSPSSSVSHIAALWALVREDYYILRGLPDDGMPGVDKLQTVARGISYKHARELCEHVPAHGCLTWNYLNHWFPRKDKR